MRLVGFYTMLLLAEALAASISHQNEYAIIKRSHRDGYMNPGGSILQPRGSRRKKSLPQKLSEASQGRGSSQAMSAPRSPPRASKDNHSPSPKRVSSPEISQKPPVEGGAIASNLVPPGVLRADRVAALKEQKARLDPTTSPARSPSPPSRVAIAKARYKARDNAARDWSRKLLTAPPDEIISHERYQQGRTLSLISYHARLDHSKAAAEAAKYYSLQGQPEKAKQSLEVAVSGRARAEAQETALQAAIAANAHVSKQKSLTSDRGQRPLTHEEVSSLADHRSRAEAAARRAKAAHNFSKGLQRAGKAGYSSGSDVDRPAPYLPGYSSP